MSARLLDDVRVRRRVAGTDPARWVLHPDFWRGQPAFVATLGASLLAIVVLARYTYPGGLGTLLSLGIQGLAVWGVVIAARRLAAADVELALAAEMEARGTDYLSGLSSGGERAMDLERLERTLPPNNTASPPPGPLRIFQQVCKEARDRRFESASALVQPYRDEATEDLFRLQNLQKIALWLGILGTFVGLLMALDESAGSAPQGDTDLLARVQEMYDGLFVSFTASVAGLEVAIILSAALLLLRRRQERCFSVMEGAVVTLLSAARHAINHDDFIHEFTQVNTTVRQLANRTRDLADRLNGVEARLRDQNDRIDTGLQRVAAAGAELDQFLRSASDAEHRFLADMGELFEAASFRDLARTLREGSREVGEQLVGRLDEIAAHGTARMEAFDGSVKELAAAVQAHSSGFAISVDRLQTEVTAASARSAEAILAACARIAPGAAACGGAAAEGNAAMLELLAARMGELDRTLRRLAPRRSPRLRDLLVSIAPRWWPRRTGRRG